MQYTSSDGVSMSPRSQLKIMPEGKIIEVRNGLGFQALERKTNSIEFDCRKADCGFA